MDRKTKSPDESVEQLTNYMFSFCQKTQRQRIIMRNRKVRLSDLLDWKKLALEYNKARRLAISRAYFHGEADEEQNYASNGAAGGGGAFDSTSSP